MRSSLANTYGQDRLPRYTSYPTAPHFSASVGEADYRAWLRSVPARRPGSSSLRVPFGRSMCWDWGSQDSITRLDDRTSKLEKAAGRRTRAWGVGVRGKKVVGVPMLGG